MRLAFRWMLLCYATRGEATVRAFGSTPLLKCMRASRAMVAKTTSQGPETRRPLVVVLTGPTAVGKSSVAAKLCEKMGGLVVSADSVQAYTGVMIGANKPTMEERQKTPHLLVDIVNADTDYNAAEWHRDALYSIHLLTGMPYDDDETDPDNVKYRRAEIRKAITQARRNELSSGTSFVPIVTGGTMMYTQWLVDGRPDACRPTKEAMAKAQRIVDDLRHTMSWEGSVEKISDDLGSPYREKIGKLFENDWYRLRRCLEVAYSTPSDGAAFTGVKTGELESYGFDVRCFFLCPTDRMSHYAVVDRRCERMLVNGLVRETVEFPLSDMVQKAIGYRQVLEYLNRDHAREKDEAAFDEFIGNFQSATRRYAKRQMQWYRKDSNFVFVPVDVTQGGSEATSEVAANAIMYHVGLSRAEYDKQRKQPETDNAKTRRINESQGKGMKLFKSQREILTKGSDALNRVLADADDCHSQYISNKLQKQTKKRTH